MQTDLIFRLLLAGLLIAFVAHRAYWHRKLRRPAEALLEKETGGVAAKVAGLLGILALLTSVLYLFNPEWVAWSSFPLPSWIRWTGIVVALFGFALLQWAHQALGQSWSDTPGLVRGQVLVTSGPYRRVRHPIYAAFLLILGAPVLISANWLVGLSWLAMTIVEISYRIRVEEALMLRHFQDQYRSYMAETGRLLPRVFRFKEWRG